MTPARMAGILAEVMEIPRPWSAAEIMGALESPLALSVATDAGFAMGRVIADEAELLLIAVGKAAQGQGAGTALLQEFLSAAAAKGAGVVYLEVAETNAPALRLYESAGFAVTGRRPEYYGDGKSASVDALIMRRAIAD